MLIDFEERFRTYLSLYKKSNEIEDEVLEERAPELYLNWLDSPKDWLSGNSPNGHFKKYDAGALIEALGEYILSDFTLPGVLLNMIADAKKETYPFLISLMKNYEGEKSDSLKKTIVRLIEEMDMIHPYSLYIEAIAHSDEKSEFAEACAEELKNSGIDQKENIISAFEKTKSRYSSDCFLDILTDLPYDEKTYNFALEKFLYGDSQKAFYASCLGKIGNESALPFLEEAIKAEETTYFEYLSVKNAFEELGGEIEIERDFSGDSDYESLKKVRE